VTPSVNKVFLIGRVANDLELRFTQSGTGVSNFALACSRDWKDAETGERGCDFIRIKVWGKQAESCCKYLAKGSLIAILGRIEVSSYTPVGAERPQNVVDVIAESVKFLEHKKEKPSEDSYDGDEGTSLSAGFGDDQPPF
jgi:single-strand DNA-binding protein